MVKRVLTLVAGTGGRVAVSALAITISVATAMGHGGAIPDAFIGSLTLAAGYAVAVGALLLAPNAADAFEPPAKVGEIEVENRDDT